MFNFIRWNPVLVMTCLFPFLFSSSLQAKESENAWQQPFFTQVENENSQKNQQATQAEPSTVDMPIYSDVDLNRQEMWDVPIKKPVDRQILRIETLSHDAKQLGRDSLKTPLFTDANAFELDGDTEGLDNGSDVWCLKKGDSLKANLINWGKKAGWNIRWNSEYDYPVDAAFCLTGSFRKAISMLINSYAEADRPVHLDLYPTQSVAVFSTK